MTPGNPIPSGTHFTVSTIALRTNQAYAVNLPTDAASTLSAGGILVGSQVGSNNVTFSGGNITGGAGNEVILHQYNTGTVTFGSGGIVNNGATAVQFTKAGTGTTIFTGTKTYTGSTNVSGGTLQLGNGLAGGNGAVSSAQIYISAGAKLVFNNADAQTVTNTLSTDGYARSGNDLDIVQKLGAGTLTMRPTVAGTNGSSVGWQFSGGIVSVNDLGNGAAGNPFGSYNSGNGTQFYFDGGAVQFTGSTVGLGVNRLYYQSQIGANGATYMADGTGGPMTVEGGYLLPGAVSRTVTLEATGGTITAGATGTSLASTGGGGNWSSVTLYDSQGQTNYSTTVAQPTSLVKTGPGIWQMGSDRMMYTGGTTVNQGTLLLTGASTSGIYIGNSWQVSAPIAIAKNASLDVGGGNTATGQKLLLAGSLKGEGAVVNSFSGGYGAVSMDHFAMWLSPGPAATASNTQTYGVGTLTMGNLQLKGFWDAGGYQWDVNSVSGAGGLQANVNSNLGADKLDIRGTLDFANCGAPGGATGFRMSLAGVAAAANNAVGHAANWNGHKSYQWVIAQTTGGFVSLGNLSNISFGTYNGFGAGNTNNDTTGGTWSLSTSGNNLMLNYTGDGAVTSTTATLSSVSNKSRILLNQTSTITTTVTNTGTPNSAQDTLAYSITDTAPTLTGGAKSNAYGLDGGASEATTHTFTGTAAGIWSVLPSATLTNAYLGTSVTPTTTGASVDVVAQRTFSPGPAADLGRIMQAVATPVSGTATYTTSGDHTTTTDVVMSNSLLTSGGLTLAAGSDSFTGSTTSGSRAIGGTFTSGTLGVNNGSFTINGTGRGADGGKQRPLPPSRCPIRPPWWPSARLPPRRPPVLAEF